MLLSTGEHPKHPLGLGAVISKRVLKVYLARDGPRREGAAACERDSIFGDWLKSDCFGVDLSFLVVRRVPGMSSSWTRSLAWTMNVRISFGEFQSSDGKRLTMAALDRIVERTRHRAPIFRFVVRNASRGNLGRAQIRDASTGPRFEVPRHLDWLFHIESMFERRVEKFRLFLV